MLPTGSTTAEGSKALPDELLVSSTLAIFFQFLGLFYYNSREVSSFVIETGFLKMIK